MSIVLIIIISYSVSILLGWIASFCFAPSIAKRLTSGAAQREYVYEYDRDIKRWVNAEKNGPNYPWSKTEKIRGGGVLETIQFKNELNLLRWLFPIGLFRQLMQISDNALIERNDPEIIAEKEAKRKQEYEDLQNRIAELEKSDQEYRTNSGMIL